MIQVFTIVTLLMGGSMFFISSDKKLALMFIACMTLTLLRMDFSVFPTANLFLVCCFLLSELKNLGSLFRRLNRDFIISLFSLLLLSFIFAVIFSPHLHSFNEVKYFFQSEFLVKYFVIVYSLAAIRTEKNLRTLIKFSVIPMLILTFFGVINLIERQSSFVSEMMSNWSSFNTDTELAGEKYAETERFRVQSMFFLAFDYGYICSLCLLTYIYALSRKMIKRSLFIILAICCLFGILMCGCRTVIVCIICGVTTYLYCADNAGKKLKVVLSISIIGVVVYSTIPFVREKVDQVTDIFFHQKGSQVEGSNLDMRSIQFAVTLYYIQDSPLFGRGVKFFNIDMGWGEGRERLKDSRLEGIEGVYLMYLLERGVIGYVLYLAVWIIMLVFLVKKRRNNKTLSALGISVWVLYILFAHMTGELLSVFPTLLILGSTIGILTTNQYIYGIKKQIFNSYPRI